LISIIGTLSIYLPNRRHYSRPDCIPHSNADRAVNSTTKWALLIAKLIGAVNTK
jgi:hypothetical protein